MGTCKNKTCEQWQIVVRPLGPGKRVGVRDRKQIPEGDLRKNGHFHLCSHKSWLVAPQVSVLVWR